MEVLVHSTTAFKLEYMHESQVPHGQFETQLVKPGTSSQPVYTAYVVVAYAFRRSPRLEWKLAEQTNTEVSVHADQHTWPRARSIPNPAHGNHWCAVGRRQHASRESGREGHLPG
jgi:hypothetical protein